VLFFGYSKDKLGLGPRFPFLEDMDHKSLPERFLANGVVPALGSIDAVDMEVSKSLLQQSKKPKSVARDSVSDYIRDCLSSSYYIKRNILTTFEFWSTSQLTPMVVDYDGLCVPRLFVPQSSSSYHDYCMPFNVCTRGEGLGNYEGNRRVGDKVTEKKLDINIMLTVLPVPMPVSGVDVAMYNAIVRIVVVRENSSNRRNGQSEPYNDHPITPDILTVGNQTSNPGSSINLGLGVRDFAPVSRFTFLYDELHYIDPDIRFSPTGVYTATRNVKIINLSFTLDRDLFYQKRLIYFIDSLDLYGGNYMNANGIYVYAIRMDIGSKIVSRILPLSNVYIQTTSAFSWVDL